MSHSAIEDVLQKHEQKLLSISGVVGLGIQTNKIGNEVIVVYARDASAKKHIPVELEGFSVEIEVSGEFRAY